VPPGALALARPRQLVKENWTAGPGPRQEQGVAG